MPILSSAVGKNSRNSNRYDVLLVQRLLNSHRPPPLRPIAESGMVDLETIAAIEEFQQRVVKMTRPDGRVDPNGPTFRALSAPSLGAFDRYYVRPGDTVASIARVVGPQCRAADIERANGLAGRYDLVVGQCLAIPKAGAVPVLPAPKPNHPLPPQWQKDLPAKTPGDPYVYFPTSPQPLPDLTKYIGMGMEVTFDKQVISKGSIAGFQGNVVEWEVSFAGVVRVGRKGLIGTLWQTPDQVLKYRADLVDFGSRALPKWYGGVDWGVKKVEPVGNGDYLMQVSLTFGSKFKDVSLEGKVTADSKGGFTFTASRKMDSETVTLDDGTEMTVRGDLQMSIRLGPDMKWVLATYSAWTLTKYNVVGWVQGGAQKLAQIDWERTAAVGIGIVSVAAAGITIYKWARFISGLQAIGEVIGAFFLGTAEVCSSLFVVILPPGYLERNSRFPGQSRPSI